MQRVVVLFVGLLSAVRATPFDLDSVDLPTFFQNNFRVEKGEFGNSAFTEDSKHEDEIGTFKSGENSNRISASDEGKFKGLNNLFGDLEDCDLITMDLPKGGCVYVANGDINFIRVYGVDIEDVYTAFEEAGIGKCKEGEDGFNTAPQVGCFRINEDTKTVHWIGAYDDDAVIYESDKVDDIKGLFGNVKKCNLTVSRVPEEGCSLFGDDNIHYFNVLQYETIDDVERSLSELSIPKCIYDEPGLVTKEPCYLINPFLRTIHFLNIRSNIKVVLDDDNDDDHYSEETYEITDAEVLPPSLVLPATGNGNLHQLTLKGLFNQRPVDVKKAKAVLSKKIQPRYLEEVEKKLGRQGRQHGNHRPQWMKYLHTIA